MTKLLSNHFSRTIPTIWISTALVAFLAAAGCGPDSDSETADNQDWGIGDSEAGDGDTEAGDGDTEAGDGDSEGDGGSPGDHDGDGELPEEVGPCSDPSLNSCHELATCANTSESYECTCGSDLEGDGSECEFIDAPCNVLYVIENRESDTIDDWTLSVPDDCSTIQEALQAALRTDISIPGTILVEPGTYLENIDFNGASVTLRSVDGPRETVLDGSSEATSVVSFVSGETAHSVLEGFTITGGSGTIVNESGYGGGINIHQSSPTLRELIVTENALSTPDSITFYGGGISIRNSSSTLEKVSVFDNSSTYYGGGLYLAQSETTIHHFLAAGNDSVYGGGIAAYYSNDSVENALILSNEASLGAGIMVQAESPRITQATLHDNQGDGVYVISGGNLEITNTTISNSTGYGVRFDDGGSADIAYGNFWENASGPTSGVETPGSGTIFENPLFKDVSSLDWWPWDLRLREGSPLINAGDPSVENPDGSRSDIGAYGGPRASD